MGIYRIRRMSDKDLKQVFKLGMECFAEGEAYPEYYFHFLLMNSDYHYVVVNESNEILGYLVSAYLDDEDVGDTHEFNIGHNADCSPNCEKTNHRRALGIASIAVSEVVRNQGVGCTLIKTFMTDVVNTSDMVTHLALQVRVSNTHAIRMYEKSGFVKSTIVLKDYYSHPKEDAYLMYFVTSQTNSSSS
jgi:ribosomal protein S18 acetylase RimI-like enzyme